MRTSDLMFTLTVQPAAAPVTVTTYGFKGASATMVLILTAIAITMAALIWWFASRASHFESALEFAVDSSALGVFAG